MKTKSKPTVTIKAVVTKKDGTIKDYRVVSSTKNGTVKVKKFKGE